MNKIFLRQMSLSGDSVDSKGEFKGVAYSGAPIKEHGFISNLIIDTSSLKVAKEKTPILKDHMTTQVAGYGKVTIGNEVLVEGKLSQKTQFGKEIIDLSTDGIDWEMSLGVYGGTLREFENETINGIELSHGTVLENGTIREVSFVILGADQNTSAEVFEVKTKKGEHMKLNQHEDWIKFACACGGNKETTPEELKQNFSDKEAEIKQKEEEIASKAAEIEALKKEIEALKGNEEMKQRKEDISSAAKEKNITFSEEVISQAAASKESTEAFLLAVKAMEVKTVVVKEEFSQKVDIGSSVKVDANDEEAIRLKAEEMVKNGEAKNFIEAINILEVK